MPREVDDLIERWRDEATIRCWFCEEPAVTVGFGFAVCGGRDETPINCSERARDLFHRSVAEATQSR